MGNTASSVPLVSAAIPHPWLSPEFNPQTHGTQLTVSFYDNANVIPVLFEQGRAPSLATTPLQTDRDAQTCHTLAFALAPLFRLNDARCATTLISPCAWLPCAALDMAQHQRLGHWHVATTEVSAQADCLPSSCAVLQLPTSLFPACTGSKGRSTSQTLQLFHARAMHQATRSTTKTAVWLCRTTCTEISRCLGSWVSDSCWASA